MCSDDDVNVDVDVAHLRVHLGHGRVALGGEVAGVVDGDRPRECVFTGQHSKFISTGENVVNILVKILHKIR